MVAIRHTNRPMIIGIGVMLALSVARFSWYYNMRLNNSWKPPQTAIKLVPLADASDADVVVSEAVEERIAAEEEAKAIADAAEAERTKAEEEARVKAEEEATRLQAVGEAKDKADVGETGEIMVREEAKIVVSEEPNLNTINVHVYGGSITWGRYLDPKTRWGTLLQSMLQHYDDDVDVVVSNFAIPAAGPEYWSLCGIGVADIIISEFRINEHKMGILKNWYELAISHCKHLVVLDVWSWLSPPTGRKSATMRALPNKGNISSVSLDLEELDTWQALVPSYFNYTGVQTIPQKCYDSIHEKSTNETQIIKWCRKAHASNMQHGTEIYHEHIANSLYTNIIDNGVLYRLKDDTPIDKSAKGTMCIGQWNLLNRTTYGNLGYWNQTIIYNKGFSIHNLHSKPLKNYFGKITLNTNSTSAQLQLTCPPPYNMTAKVGYIAHSDEEESGIIRINGSQMSTRLENENRPHVRIRQFSSSLTLPINVSVDELPTGQYIEFTGLICFSH